MSISTHIAKQFRDLHYGGNWTWSNLKDQLSDVNWEQAVARVHHFNTIAILVFHTNYYVEAITRVLEGGELNSKDELSFQHPPIQSEADWQDLLAKVWSDADRFIGLIEQVPDEQLWETFSDPKYGSYYRNLQGVIEHTHYHLGQIALIKKLVQPKEKNG